MATSTTPKWPHSSKLKVGFATCLHLLVSCCGTPLPLWQFFVTCHKGLKTPKYNPNSGRLVGQWIEHLTLDFSSVMISASWD